MQSGEVPHRTERRPHRQRDIGEQVFALGAGARFGYALLWVVALGTVGVAPYGEMSGRIAAVLQKPTFEIVKEHFGFGKALGIFPSLRTSSTCSPVRLGWAYFGLICVVAVAAVPLLIATRMGQN